MITAVSKNAVFGRGSEELRLHLTRVLLGWELRLQTSIPLQVTEKPWWKSKDARKSQSA